MLESVLRERCGLEPHKPLVVGVSGGPDSLCLLDVLRQAGYPVIVAHFDHQIRPGSAREMESVGSLARKWGLPFVNGSADVPAYSQANGLSLEEAARLLRYRFLFETARAHSAQAVATGHTADDQVETVLMHFLRGAALTGLKGMEYRSVLPVFDAEIPLVRPLLSLWRNDTEAWCREHGLEPSVDPTNADETYFRNRLRHSLIPELEKYNPRFKEMLVRTTEALSGDQALLEEVIHTAWNDGLFEQGPGWFAFDAGRLSACSTPMRRNLLRRAADALRPEARDFGYAALQRAAEFAGPSELKQTDFINGLYLFREAGRVYLAAYEADLPSVQWPQIASPCLLNGANFEMENGWLLSIEAQSLDTDYLTLNTDNWSAWLDADLLTAGLTIRPPHPGDRLQPLGMEKGQVKLSDLFVNAKIPRRARQHWSVVCSGEQVAWVPGLRASHQFRVTPATRRVLHLELKKKSK